MTHDQIHTMTWDWMVKSKEELSKIALEADKASKVGKLQDAVEMKKVKKQALDGIRVVMKIFGDVVQASTTYSYDRTK
jgi:hypothetical protein